MKEDFLHFLWKHQKFPLNNLTTTQGSSLQVVNQGIYNTHAGPDFSDARLKIDLLDWIGHVEIHIKSSDWFAHQHQQDSNYDAVILHVVWEDDVPVVTQSGMLLPTLELSKIVSPKFLEHYQKQFLHRPQWIPCEDQVHTIDSMVWTHWKERLFIERIERRSKLIDELLSQFKNDWEAVCFVLLAKNFGLNVNGASFLEVAKAIPFHVIRKNWDEVGKLEALFMGMSGMLTPPYNDLYHEELAATYSYLKSKYQLQTIGGVGMQYSRLRPLNFPTIRWAQLAQLYASTQGLFSRFIQKEDQFKTDWLADVRVSDYWKTHYVFGKSSASKNKGISKAFQELLLINTVIPLKFAYEKHIGNDPSELIFDWAQQLKPEKNSIVTGFEKLKVGATSALDSQSLIQLKTTYCDLKKCLNCSIGYTLLTTAQKHE
jgi:hypothetical protein